jgi:hypothetical protein
MWCVLDLAHSVAAASAAAIGVRKIHVLGWQEELSWLEFLDMAGKGEMDCA